jgi:hypothetical protein
MPQILKTEEELRRMILDEVRSYVVCPEGTDVTIRADLIMDGQRMSCRHPEALSLTSTVFTTSAMSFEG